MEQSSVRAHPTAPPAKPGGFSLFPGQAGTVRVIPCAPAPLTHAGMESSVQPLPLPGQKQGKEAQSRNCHGLFQSSGQSLGLVLLWDFFFSCLPGKTLMCQNKGVGFLKECACFSFSGIPAQN